MPLTPLDRPSVRPRGGVAKVELVSAPLWAGASSAAADRVAWAFREDRARYSEERTGDNQLMPLVHHVLEMELPADPSVRTAVHGLADIAAAGFVAVVTLASGEVITPGFSTRFGAAFPLRLVKSSSASGLAPADLPSFTLTFESVDADPAPPLAH